QVSTPSASVQRVSSSPHASRQEAASQTSPSPQQLVPQASVKAQHWRLLPQNSPSPQQVEPQATSDSQSGAAPSSPGVASGAGSKGSGVPPPQSQATKTDRATIQERETKEALRMRRGCHAQRPAFESILGPMRARPRNSSNFSGPTVSGSRSVLERAEEDLDRLGAGNGEAFVEDEEGHAAHAEL